MKIDGEHIHQIIAIAGRISLNMSKIGAEDRVWSLHHDCIQALKSAIYEKLPERKPHGAIRHVLVKVTASQLQTGMKNIILWENDEKLDKENFKEFMRELASQTRKWKHDKIASCHMTWEDDESENKTLC